MEIRIYNTFRNKYLIKRWKEIVHDNNYFAQNSYDWCFSWWKHFHANKKRELYIIAVFNGNDIIGIAPMLIENRFGFRELRFIGTGQTDFHQLLVEEEFYHIGVDIILRHFREFRKWDIVYLDQINDEDRLHGCLALREHIRMKYRVGCPIIDIYGLKWDEYIANIASSNLRKDYRRKSHKLEREADLEFIAIDQEEDLKLYIEEIFGLHIERWAYEGQSSKFKRQDMRSFIKEVFLLLGKEYRIRLYVLKDKKNLISYRLGFIQNGVFYDWNTSFDEKYARYSPGKIITGYVIKHLIENNYRVFHFMRGDYEYKKGWMHKDREHISSNYLLIFSKNDIKGKILERYYLVWKDKIRGRFGAIVGNSRFRTVLGLNRQ